MTRGEFKTWAQVNDPKLVWYMDQVSFYNRREMLFHTGRHTGKYINIKGNGELSFGEYTNAVPYITDGIFKQILSKKFINQSEAVEYCQSLGVNL